MKEVRTNRRYLTISMLFLFGASSTLMKGQTVNYNYDTSGNVTSKVIVQPPKVASFKIENDSIPFLNNFLAYTPIKMPEKPEHTSVVPVQVPFKISDGVNDKSSLKTKNVNAI